MSSQGAKHRPTPGAAAAGPARDVFELERAKSRLESELRDMQDFEFTLQDGCLYFLQTRSGKRTPWAALHIAIDLTMAGIIDHETALERLAELRP